MISYNGRRVSDVQADAVCAGSATKAHGMMVVSYAGNCLGILNDFNGQESGEFLFKLLFQLAEQHTTTHEVDRRATLEITITEV